MGLFSFIKTLASAVKLEMNACPAAKRLLDDARDLNTDLVIMDAHSLACPECAKYQGRVFSLYGNIKQFPKIPDEFFRTGSIHEGCGHSFYPYIHGVTNPDLRYTLSVHPLSDPRYGRDIVTFSNRPFEDDRTDKAKKEYALYQEKLRIEEEEKLYWKERQEQNALQRKQDEKDFEWLQSNFPENCPKTFTGYRRMKTQNTKNYQVLKQLAAEQGRTI